MIDRTIIYMEPDIDELFWDEDDCGIGDSEAICYESDFELKLNINGLSEWLSKYVNEILIPCSTGQISLKDLRKNYDWISFLKEGIRLAYEVRKILPDNIDLVFKTPWEYQLHDIPQSFMIPQKEKISKISYLTEDVSVSEAGHPNVNYKGFFYVIDGKKLEYKGYNPLDKNDICETDDLIDCQSLEDDDDNETPAVLLNHCKCGLWLCNSMIAQVIYEGDKVRWRIHRYTKDIIFQEFLFDRAEYEQTMNSIFSEAKQQAGG